MPDRSKPFEAYPGDDPYAFISYAHADSEEVYADITRLHGQGYRIWYDEGIEGGKDWADVIERRILGCAFFVAFLSPKALQSNHVCDEINLALEEQKQFLAVHLVPTKLAKGLKLRLGMKEAVLRYTQTPEEYFQELERNLPPLLMDRLVLYPAGSPEGDLAREIEFCIKRAHGWRQSLAEELLGTAALLGLPPERSREVLEETLAHMGIDEGYGERVEQFRALVVRFLAQGELPPERRHILANRARALSIPPEHWEFVVQEEAARRARELREQGSVETASRLLISAVGERLDQSDAVRQELEQLERPAGGGTQETAAAAEPSTSRAVTEIGEGTSLTWVRVPAGLFLRGCPEEFKAHVERKFGVEAEVFRTYPLRKEPLDEFWMALTPVTNAQFRAFTKATSYRSPAGWRAGPKPFPPHDAHKPVTGVTWQDAAEFARWLCARLPTRAEYEKACRGTEGLLFPWGNQFDPERCNTAEAGIEKPTPVDAYPEGASPFGILDLVGNVWEWAEDRREDVSMTVGASFGWTGEAYGVGFFEMSVSPESSEKDIGFRVACSDVRKLLVRKLAFEEA